ncbi:Protein kinase [Candidatus Magnetomoraceae bacterium gMMP-15]
MKTRQFTDTTDFFAIDGGDEILVDEKRYKITGHERERRFGIDDPKFWVKRAVNVESGERKIIKLSYLESFEISVGGVKIICFRNPDKESEILEFVKDHPHFMHGTTHIDPKGNNVRILDIVRGRNFFVYIDGLPVDHETYFNTMLPDILRKLVTAFEAIKFLHNNGFKHGDIRNDHIIVESTTQDYVWIDFDYDYEATENPFSLDIFGIGNILLAAIGKGFHNLYMIDSDKKKYGDLIDNLEIGDFSILDKWRFVNLRKLYPYIPRMLNDILMHFSRGTDIYYDFVQEIIDNLNWYLDSL